MGCGRPLCRRDNGPSSGNPGRPTGQVCAAQVEVRPHNAEWSPGRASHHQISPIKCGLQPIMTAQGRIRGRMPILLSLSAAGRSNPGNPGFNELRMRDNAGGKVISELESIKNRISRRLHEGAERTLHSKSHRSTATPLTKDQVLQRNPLGSEFANDREVVFLAREFYSKMFWGIIDGQQSDLMRVIGLKMTYNAPMSIGREDITGLPMVQVHSVRMASRIGKRGQTESEYVVELIQSRDGYLDRELQALVDAGKTRFRESAKSPVPRRANAENRRRRNSTAISPKRTPV